MPAAWGRPLRRWFQNLYQLTPGETRLFLNQPQANQLTWDDKRRKYRPAIVQPADRITPIDQAVYPDFESITHFFD